MMRTLVVSSSAASFASIAVAVLGNLLAGPGNSAAAPRVASPASEASLAEGWKKSVPFPDPEWGGPDSYTAWVEHGWLHVKRETKDGIADWHIVLARATDPQPPQIITRRGAPLFELSYMKGRYFIRETMGVLRVLRERKRTASFAAQDGTTIKPGTLLGAAGSGSNATAIKGVVSNSWVVVTAGISETARDVSIRLAPAKLNQPDFVFQVYDDMQRMSYKEWWLIDDGELLIADRAVAFAYEKWKRMQSVKKDLPNHLAPALSGSKWHHAGNAPSLQDYRGKVVLLDFWAVWCSPCVAHLPDTQDLYEKYKDRGFVVVGIHHQQGGEKLDGFLAGKKLTFPILLDDGKTLKRYAVETLPTYVLIDRQGKVVRGPSGQLPTAKEIASALEQK